jgi:hypothetical protein
VLGWSCIPRSGVAVLRIDQPLLEDAIMMACPDHRSSAPCRGQIAADGTDLVLAALMFWRPVVRKWGLHTSNGWVPWREYDAT